MIMNGDRENLFGLLLTDHVVVKNFADFFGSWIWSRDFTSEEVFSSLSMSMQSSTYLSHMQRRSGRRSVCALRAGFCCRTSSKACFC